MPELSQISGVQDGLIRKMVSGGAVLLAPITHEITSNLKLTGSNAQLQTLAGFKGLGRVAKDGAPVFTPEDTTEDVETWGELEPSRTDITASTLQVETTLQDTRKETLEIAARRSLDDVQPDENGEISFDDNSSPNLILYRAFFVGADGIGNDAIYFGRFLPRVMITRGPEDWNPAANVAYPMTMRAFKDNKLGYSSRRFYGGPGLKKHLSNMGFAAVSGGESGGGAGGGEVEA